MEKSQRQLINKYLDLLFRRKIFIVIFLLLSLPAGLGIYLRTPKVYQSTSLLSYQQQKINPNKMSPDVQSDIRDIVNTLSQIVSSRTSLEKIIHDFDLYPELRAKLPMEDVVEIFRKNIEIKPSSRGDVFTISYSGSQPEKVVKVTNAIAAKFIEENLKYRQERAMDTSSYTKQELEMAKKVMDEQENAMRDYKLKNFDEMPGHREANMVQLTALQVQYQGRQESIQDLERTLILIQDQINNRRTLVQHSPVPVAAGEALSSSQRLANLRATLDSLLLKYTEKHPEVIRVRQLLAKQEAEVEGKGAQGKKAASSTGIAKGLQPDNRSESFDQQLMELEVQQKDVRLNIATLNKEKEQLRARIEQYEKWVAAAPAREAEWSSLTREYDQLKRHYDDLVGQNLQAESMLNLEERQKGSQFKVEDPARYSGTPIKPNFLKIMAMAILAGLGIGVGGTLALDMFDASFRDPETIEPLLGVPLLISIPYIETMAEQKKQKRKMVLVITLLLIGMGLVVTLFALVWMRGYIVL